MELGFIGLGNMGAAIAARLLKAGHRVTVHNRTPSRAAPLQAQGAVVAGSPASAGEVVITMLADDAALEATVFGERGVIAALRPGAIHVSMSTITVALSERLAAAHGAVGQIYLAAPVFGRPDAAAAGKLFVMAAGEEQAIARCQPLFDAIGQRTFVIGDAPAKANLVKLGGNFLIAAVIESLSEAIALMRKSGVDPHRFLEVMTNTLFTAPVYRTYGDLIVEERYQPPGFAMPLGLKDIRSALAAAEAAAAPMPIASLIRDQFISGIARGGAGLDWSALGRVAAENAGL